jgi:poly-beta-1,6-N-acetyl-D-glucosamine synthase
MKYLLLTPALNEEQYIGKMIESVLYQSVLPSKWFIVNDGSTDNTADIIERFCASHPFITQIVLEKHRRLPGGEAAVREALNHVCLNDYDLIGRFDADIILSKGYIAALMQEFARDNSLGIAAGQLCVERDGTLQPEATPDYHVRGALKMYRTECFRQIGGLESHIGWDTIDEIRAWQNGWTTRTFRHIAATHQRATGAAISPRSIYFEEGMAEYFTWSHPLFVSLKTISLGMRTRRIDIPLAFAAGFIFGHIRRCNRTHDPSFIKMRRRQQIHRMVSFDLAGRNLCPSNIVGVSAPKDAPVLGVDDIIKGTKSKEEAQCERDS